MIKQAFLAVAAMGLVGLGISSAKANDIVTDNATPHGVTLALQTTAPDAQADNTLVQWRGGYRGGWGGYHGGWGGYRGGWGGYRGGWGGYHGGWGGYYRPYYWGGYYRPYYWGGYYRPYYGYYNYPYYGYRYYSYYYPYYGYSYYW